MEGMTQERTMAERDIPKEKSVLGGAVTWRRGFVNNFRRVPLAWLGKREAAEQLGTLRKQFTKPLLQVMAPPSKRNRAVLYQDV